MLSGLEDKFAHLETASKDLASQVRRGIVIGMLLILIENYSRQNGLPLNKVLSDGLVSSLADYGIYMCSS
jgi:hypothetical protein